jgi:hypothetical protein
VKDELLKRYTNVPALIYLLTRRVITLLDPESWDDKNDSYYLSVYKSQKSLKTILALCFTQTSERYHHWSVFAGGSSGICITFKRNELIEAVDQVSGTSYGSLEYLKLKAMRKGPIPLEKLPFIKRYGFKDEWEFRIIYESENLSSPTKDIGIPLSSIEKITFSPWIPETLAGPMKNIIHTINGCEKLKIIRSTLVNNAQWKEFANNVV